MKNFLYLGLSLLLLLTGCQDRTVKKLIEPVIVHPTEITTTIEVKVNTTEILDEATVAADITTDSKTDSTTDDTSTDIVADVEQDSVDTEVIETIIVAKSEDLSDLDERTIILNEIDDLLDSTLSSLDELDQDSISDDAIITEGGLE